MKLIKTGQIDDDDLDIVLCEDLIDNIGNWYDLTLREALFEQIGEEPLLYCEYVVDIIDGEKHLSQFTGWTKDQVIFHIIGIGVQDTLLDSVMRNPPV